MIEIRNQKVIAKINPEGAELTELSKVQGKNVIWEKDDTDSHEIGHLN